MGDWQSDCGIASVAGWTFALDPDLLWDADPDPGDPVACLARSTIDGDRGPAMVMLAADSDLRAVTEWEMNSNIKKWLWAELSAMWKVIAVH